MKTTMRGVLLNVDDDMSQLLDRLMRKYGYMYRYAFQRLQEAGMKIGVLERILSTETNLPLRYAKDAVAEGESIDIRSESTRERTLGIVATT
jgi:D-serine dehydratase